MRHPRATILSDWFGVLKHVVVPECGGLIWRRHDGGSERDRGRMHAEGTVRDRRLDNEQTAVAELRLSLVSVACLGACKRR